MQEAWQLSFQVQRVPVGQAMAPQGSLQAALPGEPAGGQLGLQPPSAATTSSPANLVQTRVT